MTASLSTQQARILQLLAQGMSVPEIGPHIHLSPHTVKTHIAALRAKLGATNVANLVHVAHCQNLLDRPHSGVEPTPEQKLAWATRWLAEPDVALLVAAERAAS